MNEQPIGELSYEAARDELLAVVAQLEAGTASLAESMQLWERGEKLVEHCQGWLSDARERLAGANPANAHPAGAGNAATTETVEETS